MTRFLNGPAQGKTLMLSRAPMFLRVVELGGNWDALDQIDDIPEPMETIHVYQRKGEAGVVHLDCGGKGKKSSGWYTMAEYVHLDPQPDEDEIRRTDAWQAWSRRNAINFPTTTA